MKEHTETYALFTGAATALATPFADGEAAGPEETEVPEETETIEEEYTGAHILAEESEPEAEEPLPEDLPEELIEEQPEEPLPEVVVFSGFLLSLMMTFLSLSFVASVFPECLT